MVYCRLSVWFIVFFLAIFEFTNPANAEEEVVETPLEVETGQADEATIDEPLAEPSEATSVNRFATSSTTAEPEATSNSIGQSIFTDLEPTKSGDFSYSVPIKMPEFHGLEPNVSLNYSSSNKGAYKMVT